MSLVFIATNSFSQDKIEKELVEIRKDIAVIKEGQSSINQRIDDLYKNLNQRVDDLKDIMVTGFAILVSGMCILIGFILWDRRTALARR